MYGLGPNKYFGIIFKLSIPLWERVIVMNQTGHSRFEWPVSRNCKRIFKDQFKQIGKKLYIFFSLFHGIDLFLFTHFLNSFTRKYFWSIFFEKGSKIHLNQDNPIRGGKVYRIKQKPRVKETLYRIAWFIVQIESFIFKLWYFTSKFVKFSQ